MEQGSFVYENNDGSFSHTLPDQYAPKGEHYKGTAFGPAMPIPIPEGTKAIAIALPPFDHDLSMINGYGDRLVDRPGTLGKPIFVITTGRDRNIYLAEPSGWTRLR